MGALVKNRTTIQIIGGFIILMFIYNIFFKSEGELSDLSTGASSPSTLGADLLKISTDLSKASLSQQLFSKSGYLYLRDFSTPLPQQPVGRTNPFDIIGRE